MIQAGLPINLITTIRNSMKFVLRNKTFEFSWLGLTAYLLLLSLLCSLGFWQLRRSEQKARWLQQQQAAMLAESIDLNQNQENRNIDMLRYHKAVVVGHYDSE